MSPVRTGEAKAELPLSSPPVPISTRRAVPVTEPDENSRLVFVTEPNGVAVEQYKILRHRLVGVHPRGGVMLITSPGPGEGKTLTSANLAWCLAEGGHRTCLVDLDFRAPGLSKALNLEAGDCGIEDVLAGTRGVHQAMRQPGEFPFSILPIRRRRASPGSLLSGDSMAPTLAKLRSMHDWVILDLAPAVPMADVAEVLPHVDGALLVVRSAKTSRSLVEPTLNVLGSALWGVVFNDAVISGSGYYGSYGSGG